MSHSMPAGTRTSKATSLGESPAGMLWLMGDHRSNSADSRSHLGDPGGGMVPERRVIGRVMNVLWPLDRIGSVPVPGTFAKVPSGE